MNNFLFFADEQIGPSCWTQADAFPSDYLWKLPADTPFPSTVNLVHAGPENHALLQPSQEMPLSAFVEGLDALTPYWQPIKEPPRPVDPSSKPPKFLSINPWSSLGL